MEDKSEEWDKQEKFNEIEDMGDIAEVHLIKDGIVKIFKNGERIPEGYKLFAIKLRDGRTIQWIYYYSMMVLKKSYQLHRFGYGL